MSLECLSIQQDTQWTDEMEANVSRHSDHTAVPGHGEIACYMAT